MVWLCQVMGHGGKVRDQTQKLPRLNPPPHPQAGCPSGSTYLGNLSNHYPLPSSPSRAAGKVGIRRPAPKGAADFEEITVSLKRYRDTELEFFSRRCSAKDSVGAYPASGVEWR